MFAGNEKMKTNSVNSDKQTVDYPPARVFAPTLDAVPQ